MQSPDAKRTQRLDPGIKVQHEVKPTLVNRLSMSFTSFTPDFLWAKKFQNQILHKRF